MPARRDLNKILIIGSGPIVIGQACEFDYSGTQAVKALSEKGYRVVLVNSNPATVMTTPGIADAIYMEPLKLEYIREIIKREHPDALLSTMGGQTALNLAAELDRQGVLAEFGVELIGANIDTIRLAEERGEFKNTVSRIGLESPCSTTVSSVVEARMFYRQTELPLIIRPSYTLGGQGGSIAFSEEQIDLLVTRALAESPVHTALIEESLIGWKEFELEVIRDREDNTVVVCSIENIDPVGVHTGDSITVAPVQTLSDPEYQRMRSAAIDILRAVGVDCGGSNVQFAVDPDSGRMVVIEMNPRVSRSSALASKATGFPIARCAALLAVGFTLDEINNEITKKTVSCFEPALDYCAVKVPRFELEKFPKGYHELGTQMKSVGEALAIGRTFPEALNKALRAVESGFEGLTEIDSEGDSALWEMIRKLHPKRIFAIFSLIARHGKSVIDTISEETGYDRWFLWYLHEQAELEKELSKKELTPKRLFSAKRWGLSDVHIAGITGRSRAEISSLRERWQTLPSYHFVDTCAGEFEAETPYFYSSYGETDEWPPLGSGSVLIVGSGPNRIGQGLEFDTCCTLASMAYRHYGVSTIMINSNPETVSTDFNISDRLYLEPVTAENVLEIVRKEKPDGVVLQLGGQTALNMIEEIEAAGANIVGTPVKAIKELEDRGLFASAVQSLGLRHTRSRLAGSVSEAEEAAKSIGFPVLIRPSYVLGGRSMGIAYNPDELGEFLSHSVIGSPDTPVLVDEFLEDAFEYDLDALADGWNVYIAGIMQHIEAAGVHSGDSACVFPPYKADEISLEQMKRAATIIAREFAVRGFLNIQFAVKCGTVYVLEVNPRASRTVPFLSKTSGVNLVEAAVRVWCGEDLKTQGLINDIETGLPGVGMGRCITGWAVKEAVFSFGRFHNIDPILTPEMKSTGEVIGIGKSFGEAFAKATSAAGSDLPVQGRVFISVNDWDKETILPVAKDLESMGFKIAATRGTAQFLFKHGIFAEVILKVHEGHPDIIDHLEAQRIDLVINTPLGRYTQRDDDYIRIETVRHKIPYTTTTSAAEAAVEGIRYLMQHKITIHSFPKGKAVTHRVLQ